MKKSYKQICCVDSVYSLLIYLIKFPEIIDETYFFVSKGIDIGIRERLPNVKYVPIVRGNRFVQFFYHIWVYFYLCVFTRLKNISLSVPIYGHDFLKWSDYFVHNTNSFYLIEDGVGNYIYPQKFYKKYHNSRLYRFLVDYLPMFNLPFGLSTNVKEILLTNILEVPSLIRNKSVIISIEKAWNLLSKDHKKRILSIYIPDDVILKELMETDRKILLLTQCFSEDGEWTENEKIDKYEDILKDYSLNDVIIKTHPREKTNYKEYFPDALIISYPIPFQLLNILGLKIKVALTYNSTAIYCLPDDVKKIIVGKVN